MESPLAEDGNPGKRAGMIKTASDEAYILYRQFPTCTYEYLVPKSKSISPPLPIYSTSRLIILVERCFKEPCSLGSRTKVSPSNRKRTKEKTARSINRETQDHTQKIIPSLPLARSISPYSVKGVTIVFTRACASTAAQ